MTAKTLTLIDGSSYVFRAFHALPSLSNSKGQPTNALLGFANMLQKALRDFASSSHFAMVFDARGETFRDALYAEYKATRSPPPPELVAQFALTRDITRAFNVPCLEVSGVEADDVIATLAAQARAQGMEVVVVTGDKDFMQLVDAHLVLVDTMKETRTDVAAVKAKLGIEPTQVVDYMALIGDDVDNVPGLDGVGPKTAAKLIQQFGSLDALLADTSKIDKPKLRTQVEASLAQLQLNRQLVKLKDDVVLPVTLDDLARKPIDVEACRKLFTELEFTRLVRELPAPEAGAAPVVSNHGPATTLATPELVTTTAQLEGWVAAIASAPRVALRTVRGEDGRAFGLALALPDRSAYLPFGHAYLGVQQLEERALFAALGPWLADAARPKFGHRIKDDVRAIQKLGHECRGVAGDAELASFLLDSARRDHALAALVEERLGTSLPPLPETSGKKAAPLQQATTEQLAGHLGRAAQAAALLEERFATELLPGGFDPLYRQLEVPLIEVLAAMERAGIALESGRLQSLSHEVDRELQRHLDEIQKLAGHPFLVSSNQQLAHVLFEELKLPVLKKTKTGISVDQEVLEKLAEQHPLPRVILEHRSLAKLKSTYLDTLPALADGEGRIHTTYNQSGAATGRLSSTDPNLQNIPVRTDLGRRIREAFVAPKGTVLISADYSQIELRILAHVSQDEALLDSFRKGEDVHTRTAAEVFGVPIGEVTSEHRRAAKAVNFGIAYGQTSFGLSQRLDIGGHDAQQIIDRYFARYAGVRRWLDATIEGARKEGHVSTLFGRKRAVPDINARNFALRGGAERIAVNTPIQGTAADVMKRAMLAVARALKAERLGARMLLQVHDELVIEVPEAEVEQVAKLTQREMEGAAELSVKLDVDVGRGPSWAEAH